MSDVEIIRALPEDRALVANLLEFYVYDFSELLGLDVAEDGRFGYQDLPLYWSEPGRYAFLIRKAGRLAGLVLVQKEGDLWDIAEFFVLRAYRRQGVAIQAAKAVWTRFPGEWRVRVRQRNVPALHFWELAIAEFAGQEVRPTITDVDGDAWSFFLFELKASRQLLRRG